MPGVPAGMVAGEMPVIFKFGLLEEPHPARAKMAKHAAMAPACADLLPRISLPRLIQSLRVPQRLQSKSKILTYPAPVVASESCCENFAGSQNASIDLAARGLHERIARFKSGMRIHADAGSTPRFI